jgi:hypothetical protein
LETAVCVKNLKVIVRGFRSWNFGGGLATRLPAGQLTSRGSNPGRSKKFFFSPMGSQRVWGTAYSVRTGAFSFPGKVAVRKAGLSRISVAEFKMNGATPPPSRMPSWPPQVKIVTNFIDNLYRKIDERTKENKCSCLCLQQMQGTTVTTPQCLHNHNYH